MAKGKSFNDFRAKFVPPSLPEKVARALAQLGDAWESTSEFARRCGTSPKHLANVAEEFAEHRVAVKNPASGFPTVVWAGTKKFAKALRTVPGVKYG